MKNEPTQPTQEQPQNIHVELEAIQVTDEMRMHEGYGYSDAVLIREKGNDFRNLATIHPWGNPQYFAQRIVKGVNVVFEIENKIEELNSTRKLNALSEFGEELLDYLQELLKQA